MKFTINDRIWAIYELDQTEFLKDDGKEKEENPNEYFLGRTKFAVQEIWLWCDLSEEQKAYVFSTINSNQRKVSNSLIYDFLKDII